MGETLFSRWQPLRLAENNNNNQESLIVNNKVNKARVFFSFLSLVAGGCCTLVLFRRGRWAGCKQVKHAGTGIEHFWLSLLLSVCCLRSVSLSLCLYLRSLVDSSRSSSGRHSSISPLYTSHRRHRPWGLTSLRDSFRAFPGQSARILARDVTRHGWR